MKKLVVVFSGAGLSAESGIPTFRDADGLWENHKVMDVAHPDGWRKDKKLVLEFYKQRFLSIKNAQPNEAHISIAKLQEKFDVINITQNIDDLLERAECKNIVHLHGSILGRKCEWHKSNTMLDGDTHYTCDYATTHDKPIEFSDLCPKCNNNLRPDVVWFEEPVINLNYEYIRDLVKEIKYNDGIFICVGTSGQVYPAAALIPMFTQVTNKYIIDLKPKKIGNYTLLEGKASEKMKELAERLLQ